MGCQVQNFVSMYVEDEYLNVDVMSSNAVWLAEGYLALATMSHMVPFEKGSCCNPMYFPSEITCSSIVSKPSVLWDPSTTLLHVSPPAFAFSGISSLDSPRVCRSEPAQSSILWLSNPAPCVSSSSRIISICLTAFLPPPAGHVFNQYESHVIGRWGRVAWLPRAGLRLPGAFLSDAWQMSKMLSIRVCVLKSAHRLNLAAWPDGRQRTSTT